MREQLFFRSCFEKSSLKLNLLLTIFVGSGIIYKGLGDFPHSPVYVCADMVELADTIDLGSIAKWRAGSSPVIRIY